MNGLLGLKRRKWALKISPFLIVLQVCEPRTSSAKSMISSGKIDAEQWTNSKTYPGYPGAPFSTFCTIICKCNEWLLCLRPGSSRNSRGIIVWKPVMQWRMQPHTIQSSSTKSSQEVNYGYDPKSKQQLSQWKSPGLPRPENVRQVKSNFKMMLIRFFDIKRIVHSKFTPQNQTIHLQFYLEVLKRLRRSVVKNLQWNSSE